jgi:hypothetical protein
MTKGLKQRVTAFTDRLILVENQSAAHVCGLIVGALGRHLRATGVTREKFLEACALLWDNNNQPDQVEGTES